MPDRFNDGNPPFGDKPVFVVGATGYIGARLVPRLLAAGYSVRCLARTPAKLTSRSWATHPAVRIVQGDLVHSENLAALLQGCGAAFYLVHSLTADASATDPVEAARRFVAATEEAGIARIICLAGPAAGNGAQSPSHAAVDRVLKTSAVPVTIFNVGLIIGSGSASFEILRYLAERLPILVAPRWARSASRPISIRNVLHYLVACLAEPQTVGRTFTIGGPDSVTCVDLMRLMGRELQLRRRLVVPVPIAAPRLSAVLVDLITPVSRDRVVPFMEALTDDSCDDQALALMPQQVLTAREAIAAALAKIESGQVESTWSAAGAIPGDPDWAGGTVLVDRRETIVRAPADDVFRAVCRLGGRHGWHVGQWLWRVRGWLDELAGGPGLKRGRRDPDTLYYGEAVDFWRVTAAEQGRHLRLRAEMKLPGEALLEFSIDRAPEDGGRRPGRACRLEQTARFLPRGLLGLAYWYSMKPFHAWLFNGLLRGIRKSAQREATRREQARDTCQKT